MDFLKNILRGAVIGTAEIIPGVSGGTMAVLMGIYDKLIESISHLRKNYKSSLHFLIPLLIGMGAALIALSHVITFLFEKYPTQVNFFFVGLILGILPLLFRKATEGEWRKIHVLPMLLMIALMAVLAFFSTFSSETVETVIKMDFWQALRFVGVGFLAAVCLMLPGISGSMIMVIFGTYYSVISAIKSLDILYLIPAGIGILAGLIFGSKAIHFCLKNYPNATYFTIIGLVVGSLFTIFQKSGFSFSSPNAIISIIILIIGAAISYFFTTGKLEKINSKNKSREI